MLTAHTFPPGYHTFSNVLTSLYLNETGPVYAAIPPGADQPIRPCDPSNDTCTQFYPTSNFSRPNIPAGTTEPSPDTALINAQAQWNCTKEDGDGCGGASAVLNVVQGKRYRLRLISAAAFAPFMFSVDNHPLQIMEIDGHNVNMSVNEPIPGIQLAAGQRYSVIINASAPIGKGSTAGFLA